GLIVLHGGRGIPVMGSGAGGEVRGKVPAETLDAQLVRGQREVHAVPSLFRGVSSGVPCFSMSALRSMLLHSEVSRFIRSRISHPTMTAANGNSPSSILQAYQGCQAFAHRQTPPVPRAIPGSAQRIFLSLIAGAKGMDL